MSAKLAGLPHGFPGAVLEKLDAAAGTSGTALRTPEERKWFEHDIWTLVYRVEQALHHRDAIAQALEQLAASGHEPPGGPLANKLVRRTTIVRDHRPAFELSACLAAVRSALDVIANIAATFFQGFDRGNNSLHDLIKILAKKGSSSPLATLLAEHWQSWAKGAKEYRDDLIHRTILYTHAQAEELHFQQGRLTDDGVSSEQATLLARAPIVVPLKATKRPITRGLLLMQSEEMASEGLIRSEMHGSATLSDGSTFTMKRNVTFEVAPGFVEVGEFADTLCAKLVTFAVAVLDSCAATNFTFVEKKPPK